MIGHSLGSLILFDLLSGQRNEKEQDNKTPEKAAEPEEKEKKAL